MNKKTIIYIACAVAVTLIIAVVICFILTSNNPKSLESEPKIIITKYNENFEIEKTIEITNKKQMQEINKICENPSLEQDDTTPYLAIRNDIKVELQNGIVFIVQADLPEYCYYENANSNTKLVIKMPKGLIEKVNEFLK